MHIISLQIISLIVSSNICQTFLLIQFSHRLRSSSFDNSLIHRQNSLNTLSPIPLDSHSANTSPSHHYSQGLGLQINTGLPYSTAIPYNHHNNHSNNSPLPGQLRKASSAAALDMRGGRGGDFGGSSNHLRVPSVTRSKTFSAGPHSPHVMYSPPKVREGKVSNVLKFKRQQSEITKIITCPFKSLCLNPL